MPGSALLATSSRITRKSNERSRASGSACSACHRPALSKSTVNRYSKHSKKKRRNKLPYGTCRLKISDTRVVHEIYGAIQEYGSFDRKEWLM